jgi:F-type H+/Na+-transporting ATPase subunit beta
VLVHGGAGVGRNVLLAELAELARRRGDTASVWAFWQREPWSDAELEAFMRETRVGEHVHVLRHEHDADEAAARDVPARALALCDQLIDRGIRHVQLTFFEQPGVRASIEALLPALGTRVDGSAITTFVVPPWQTAGAEPVALKPPFDASIGFDPALAAAICFPAIDAQRSRSRLLEGAKAGDHHAECAAQACALLRELSEPATGAERGATFERARRLRAYLTQPFHVTEAFSGRPGASVPLADMLADVRAILAGRTDPLAVEPLAYRGALGERN